MARRTDWLTEIAKPVADKLAARCGSTKMVLSAGVMALNYITPEWREYFMATAAGEKAELPQIPISEKEYRALILKVVEDAQAIPVEKKRGKKANSSKSA